MDERSKADGVGAANTTAAGELKTAAADVKQAIRDTTKNVKAVAAEQTGLIKDQALSAIGDVQAKAADQAATAATTLRNTADGLDGDLPWMRTALNKTADGLETLTSALSTGDINDVLDSVKEFSKRQPALFLGLSVAAGFAMARIGKTAVETAQPATQPAAPNGAAIAAPNA